MTKAWAWIGCAVLCVTGTASAQPFRIIIDGTGPTPKVTVTTPEPPAPPAPPLPPPPIVPPVVDTSPFVFPAEQPGQENDGEARYYNICPQDGGCYAGLPRYRNPLAASHAFACYLPMGMVRTGSSLGGMRLYVPRNLGPTRIRTLCAGGSI